MRGGWLKRGYTPERLLDLLEIDGGWLTVEGIAADLRVNTETANRALFRLRRGGRVMSRRRDRALEWRAP